jgi:hypothetical protein
MVTLILKVGASADSRTIRSRAAATHGPRQARAGGQASRQAGRQAGGESAREYADVCDQSMVGASVFKCLGEGLASAFSSAKQSHSV